MSEGRRCSWSKWMLVALDYSVPDAGQPAIAYRDDGNHPLIYALRVPLLSAP